MTGAVTTANAGLGMSQLEAQAIYGIYVRMVYFLAVPGGWLADNLLGHQRAVFYVSSRPSHLTRRTTCSACSLA